MAKVVQSELDRFEEYILSKVFADINNIKLSKKIQLYLIAKNIDIVRYLNDKIETFETFAKDFIDSSGCVQGNKLTEFVITKYPCLKGCITFPSVKPIEYAKLLDAIIGFDALGKIIQEV